MLDQPVATPDVLYSILSISGGLVLLAFGIRFFRTVIALSAFAAVSLLSFILLANLHDHFDFGKHAQVILLGGSFAGGLLGAILGLWVWMVALGAVGALGGFSVGLLTLTSWKWLGQKVKGPVERPLFIAGAALAGTVLALIYEKAVIVIGTSLTGAVAVVSGMDVFVKSGWNALVKKILISRQLVVSPSKNTMGMALAAVGLCTIGIVFQYKVTGKEKRKAV